MYNDLLKAQAQETAAKSDSFLRDREAALAKDRQDLHNEVAAMEVRTNGGR